MVSIEKYEAAMILSGVGDAMGYKNGQWEFNTDGAIIHNELALLGGVDALHIKLPGWRISDDTVMHLATAEALIQHGQDPDKERLYRLMLRNYLDGIQDMGGRAPGGTTLGSLSRLRCSDDKNEYRIMFLPNVHSCGAAMRAMCIGLRYPAPEMVDDLVAVSVESGRITHHHPTAYLGALAAALFTSYAVQGKPLLEWGEGLMGTLAKALQYIKESNFYVKENVAAWNYFPLQWDTYMNKRNLHSGQNGPTFPEKYDVIARDAFYEECSLEGWGGASGHDAPMIAYDALLGCGEDWRELCKRGILHGGDNDSSGVMAACWFGAIHGFQGVPECNYKDLEYFDRLRQAGHDLFKLSGLSE